MNARGRALYQWQNIPGRLVKPFVKTGLIFAGTHQTSQKMQRLLILFLGCSISYSSLAQLRIGIFGGVANYQGDLVDKPYQNSRGAAGLTLSYQLNSHFSLRAGLTLAKVAGADSLNKKELRMRNLSFQSRITEFSLVGEFNTFDLEQKNWSPYLFAGVAVYHFNPYTFDRSGNKVFLHPLSTEGQGLPGYDRKPYALTQLAIPVGAGIKYNLSDHVRIALEAGLRKLFTDYLDDVSGNYADPNDLLAAKGQKAVDLSYRGGELPGGNPAYPAKGAQRGSPKYKDYYYFTGLHLSFLLPGGSERSYGGGKKNGYGCPSVF